MAVGTGLLRHRSSEEYKCDSNQALIIKLVHSAEDVLSEESSFHPVMSHQVFGDSETVFGYKDLQIQLYYHAGSLLTYLGMKYIQKVPAAFGIPPDPVLPSIVSKIPAGYVSNLDQFISKLPKENESFVPMGSKLHQYSNSNRDCDYEIYQADISVPRLREYHERLQTFLLWYIDAASYIDVDDEKWNFFLLFEKKRSPLSDVYSIVGYVTVYHYYAYPASFRPRVSQMLILPPYQKKGHGAELLEVVSKYYIANPKAVDITVEDPSEDFATIRDFVDCRGCAALDCFHKKKLLAGYSEEMENMAFEKRKITKKQARRVYEILRLQATNMQDVDSYRMYRLDVKRRLNVPYQKQARDLKKLRQALSPEEQQAAMMGNSPQERMHRLDEAYKELEQEYKRVIQRLEKL